MRSKLYVEASVISYLTAKPTRGLLVAANQQITDDWWKNRRAPFIEFDKTQIWRILNGGERAIEEGVPMTTRLKLDTCYVDVLSALGDLKETLQEAVRSYAVK